MTKKTDTPYIMWVQPNGSPVGILKDAVQKIELIEIPTVCYRLTLTVAGQSVVIAEGQDVSELREAFHEWVLRVWGEDD